MKYLNKFILNENVAQANSLLKRLKISEKDPDYIKIREMLRGHDGYVYWFTKLRFGDNQSMEDIKNIWDLIKDTNGVTSYFTKKIVDLESVEDFWDQYEAAKLFSVAKKVLNQFPSKQKSFFNLKDSSDLDILTQLGKSKSLSALIKKISSFRDKKSLLDGINRLLTSSFDGKFGELIKTINGINSNIVVADEDNNIIICQVDFEQIKVLGGDSSWCIVRAESTFDSYVSGGFQWVIFLVDNFGVNDRMSKIGLTTNVGYYTAHDKYDGHISKDKIQQILKDRGVELSDLYVSKEILLSMSNWDSIPVETLIEKKIAKEEIVKRKLVFKQSYQRINAKPDLSFFTEEEIEKWNLNERTELNWTGVASMKFDEVIRTNALSRLVSSVNFINVVEKFNLTKEQVVKYKIYDFKSIYNTISTLNFFTKEEIIKLNILSYINNSTIDILELFKKFTKEEIIKYKLFDHSSVYINSGAVSYFTKDELIKYNIINRVSSIPFNILVNIGFTKGEIIKNYSNKLDSLSSTIINFFKGKTKKQIITRLYATFWSDDLKTVGIEREDLNRFKLLTLSIYDIDSKEIPLKANNRDKSILNLFDKFEITKEIIDTLVNLGYVSTVETFKDFSRLFITEDSYDNISKLCKYVKLRELFKDNKDIYDICTSKVIGVLKSSISCDYYELMKSKDILEKIPEYDLILRVLKASITPYHLKTNSDNSSSYSGSYSSRKDISKTIDFIKELKYTKSDIDAIGILKFTEAFEADKLDNTNINKVIEFYKSYGFEIGEKEEISIIEGMLRFPYDRNSSNEKKIYKEDFYKVLIERGIKVEDSLNNLFNYYYKNKNSIVGEEAKYKELYSKGGEKFIKIFEDETIEIKKRELHINVIKGLGNLFNSRVKDNDMENWYDKYFDIYNDVHNSHHRWDKFRNDIRVIWVLARLNKFDEFNKIPFVDLDVKNNRGFSFDDNQVHSFAKALCGFASDTKDITLNQVQIKKVYDWLITKLDTSQVQVNKYLLVCYFLFDKERYDDFINNKLNTIKNNFGTKTTLRIDILRYMLKYFQKKGDFDDFKKLVDNLLSNIDSNKNKMGVNEYKKTVKYLDDNFESTRSEFGKKVYEYIKEIKYKYKDYFKDIKESFILKWEEFKKY